MQKSSRLRCAARASPASILAALACAGVIGSSGGTAAGSNAIEKGAQQVQLKRLFELKDSMPVRGGRGFSDGGESGFLPGQYSNRRTEIHEETKT
jgi:hypothetical protein